VRGTVILAVAVPVVLTSGFFIARLGARADLARSFARTVYFVLAVEFIGLLALALFGRGYENRARERDAVWVHPPGQLIDLGGYRLHLNCSGAGSPTVILEHGHQANSLDWYLVQPEIARFTRVCSYDRGGCGWSDPSPAARVPSQTAEELHRLLEAAQEKPPYIVIGHSFGSFGAVMFAHKYPDEVAGLVLVDGTRPESLTHASWRGRLWLRTVQVTMPFGLPRWRRWCGNGPDAVRDAQRVVTCRSVFYETALREASLFPQSAAELQAIASAGSVPLVVIARDPASGGNSPAESRHQQLQQAWLKLSTNSRLMIASGSGHDVPLARPDIIANAVKSLLTSPEPAGNRETP
jgi:pimeloyl-ACP methyl ester carboxylesterase